ncbi:HK97 family phage prohead protease [Actinomadura violacea]|uniref:HK97 family phage prohead protease n=1 Tax=Actinomadura violacea TaxID=2819934 RepID=A0ABS3S0A3_9ACTN|nr:HK97 family phage prohead protease [Actinomadura violacea]MBO2461695.1 HK97 family phage prohead protease [Actinomadura violacea]
MGTGSVAFAGTPGLEYKTATAVAGPAETGADSGVIGTDDETGVVEAIVSVTGVVDNDHDIIEPGAYKATLARRRPKGIFSHDWKQWASRTEHVEELMPGDPRLAEYAKKIGKQWPVEAGGLYVRTRYNLATNEGKSAYENVKFFGDECEWSIGYKVPAGKSSRAKDGVRRIKEVDLFEYSPVLFGAASLSGTLSVKAASVAGDVEDQPADAEPADAEPADGDAVAEAAAVLDALAEAEAVAEALAADTEETGQDGAEQDGGVEVPGPPDAQPVDGHGPDGAAQDDEPAEDAPAEGGAVHDNDGQAEDTDEVHDGGTDDGPDEGQDEPAGDTEPTEETAEPAQGDGGAEGDGAGTEESKGLPPGMKRKPAPKSGSGSRATTPGGDSDTWKITNVDELRAAIRAFGSAPGDKEKIRAHIMKRAFALNRPDLIPDGWKKDSGGKKSIALSWSPEQKILAEVVGEVVGRLEGEPYRWQGGAEGKMRHEPLDSSPKKNWVELAGQLPAYIQHIAKDLHEEKGMPLGQAIPTAIAAVKKWAAGGGGVTPETRAKAAAAVAEWEKLKATSHARTAARRAGDAAKKDTLDGWTRVKAHLPGSFEQLHDELQAAAAGLLADGEEPGLVELLGTWPDRVVATRYPAGGDGKAVSFEIPYTVAGDGVEMGEPVPVRIAVDHGGVSGDGADLGPFPAMVDDVAAGVKTLLDVAGLETKAGKVLSGANATRLKQAVEHLVAVLKVAGIEIGEPDEQEPEEQPPSEQDSTAPSARGESIPAGKCVVDPSVHARAYRILADVHARR